MALVSRIRKAETDEPGDIHVKVMIRREGAEIWSHLNLQHIFDECYAIVGGDHEAIMLFGDGKDGERVYVKPIANRDLTHLVTQ